MNHFGVAVQISYTSNAIEPKFFQRILIYVHLKALSEENNLVNDVRVDEVRIM